ncbi:hypothetical protein QTO34_000679 [Cnephaeus nilssonii]|uniref:CCHC-type domain-containing protein n=1 Tax=Cnephaeus nilssonii TaxID=3371016 RepID=A0AA40IBW6_CNENI|nr:hypothetical protein QTO34_000679 [Eptesicus nilssonii]
MDITKIIQGPEEPYQDFVARLLQAVDRVVGDPNRGFLLVKQLAFENANRTCQEALGPYRKRESIPEFICICADIGPSYVQGVTLAAALKESLQRDHSGSKEKRSFTCGRPGHFAKNCKQRVASGGQRSSAPSLPAWQPSLCPCCRKGKHWASGCGFQTDIDGQPIDGPAKQQLTAEAGTALTKVEAALQAAQLARVDLTKPLQSEQCITTMDLRKQLIPPFKKLKITPSVMMPAQPPAPKGRVRKQAKATREASVPTWGQLKKLTTDAQQVVKEQGFR